MLTYESRGNGKVIELVLDGDVRTDEFDALIVAMESGIERHGRIKVLEHVRSVGRIPPTKLWDDLKFGFKHIKDISHAAVVADKKWIELFAKGVAPLMPGEVRYFRSSELDSARAWLAGGDGGLHIERMFAHLSCSDLTASSEWYERLFGRCPDAEPMAGLREWHHGATTGLQLFHAPENAGKGTLTLIVSDLAADRQSLIDRGLSPGQIEPANYVSLIRLRDPDDNLVVLAEPKS